MAFSAYILEGWTGVQELSTHVLLWVSCDVGLTKCRTGSQAEGCPIRPMPIAVGKRADSPKGVVGEDPDSQERRGHFREAKAG